MYPIEIKLASRNGWSTPQEVPGIWGVAYQREGVTIHWWGDGTGASNHDNIVNYMLAQAQQGIKSVNYVVSDNKITMLVAPENVAWCSQSGNPTTVSFECQPTLGDEGYKKAGWLVWQLEQRFGHRMSIYGHNHWWSTSCPGTLDLGRIRAEADKWNAGVYTGVNGAGDEMITDTTQAHQAYQLLRPNGDGSDAEIAATAGRRTWKEFAASAQPEVSARNAALRDQAQQLANAQATLTQLNASVTQLQQQDLNDQNATKAALAQVATLTAQLAQTHMQLNAAQAKLSPPPIPKPSVFIGLLIALVSAFAKTKKPS